MAIGQIPGSGASGTDPGEKLIHAVQVKASRHQGVAAVQIGEGIFAIVGETGCRVAAARGPAVFFDAVAQDVVDVGDCRKQSTAGSEPILNGHQLVVDVVNIRPGVVGWTLGFARLVAVGVVGIGPDAGTGQLIRGAGRIAGHCPVAGEIVGVAGHTIAGQFRILVIGVGGGAAAVQGFADETMGQIVSVGIVGDVAASAVLLLKIGDVAGAVIRVGAGADERGSCQVAVAGFGCQLAVAVVGQGHGKAFG